MKKLMLGVIVRRRVLGKHLAFCHVQEIIMPCSWPQGQQQQQYQHETTLQHNNGHVLRKVFKEEHTAENDDFCHHQQQQQQQQQQPDGSHGGNNDIGDDSSQDKNNINMIIRVAFRRSSKAWDLSRDDTFPTKVSRLPYGATVLLELQPVSPVHAPSKQEEAEEEQQRQQQQDSQRKQQQPQNYDWEVCRWQILVHPDMAAHATSAVVVATKMHKNNKNNNNIHNDDDHYDNDNDTSKNETVIVSVPAYLRARGNVYRELHPEPRPKKIKQPKRIVTNNNNNNSISTTTTTSNNDPHGDAQAKCQRASVFCQWLLETFFFLGSSSELFNVSSSSSSYENSIAATGSTTTVMDVACGKGQLSIELACSPAKVRCIMVDPMIRGQQHDPTSTNNSISSNNKNEDIKQDDSSSLQILGKRARKRIFKAGGTLPIFLPAYFDATHFVEEHAHVLQNDNVALLVGLHPDQCTEAIVDVALRLGKSFAVVPCCVFGDLFPVRVLRLPSSSSSSTTTTGNDASDPAAVSAVPVRTYEQFLQYLRQKDPRIQQATLPICGKNQVLYLHQ
jgi:hypothetical protein